MRALQNKTQDYKAGNLTWNFCQYAAWPANQPLQKANTFAYEYNDKLGIYIPVTDGKLMPNKITVKEDLDENRWIEFKHYSVQACNSTSTYSFTAEILCDKSITSAGNPKIISVDTSHCEAKVVVAHKAGCPAGKAMNLSKFINDYPWVLGLIMIVGGPIVALFGRRWFPWVTAGIVTITSLLLCLIFCEITGFMDKPIEIVASVIFSLSLALLSGWFVMKTVWVAIGILGVIGGLFVGEVVYAFLIFELGAHQLWVMVLFCVFCASLGGLLSFYFSKKVVLFATSLIGSYSFMRGWSYFFGGFPNEEDILLSLYENMQL